MSLRSRLLLLNGLVLVLVLGGFAGVAYVSQWQSLQRDLDSSLREQARLIRNSPLLSIERLRGRPRGPLFPGPTTFTAPDVFIQVTTRDGETIARSRNLEEQALPSTPEMLQRALAGEEGFADVSVDGQPLRMFIGPARLAPAVIENGPVGMVQVARPLSPLYDSLGSLRTTFLTIGGVGVLVSLLAGWILARAALRPIERLATAAHAIGADRDFGRRVPLRSGGRRDEIGRLTEELNDMLAQLQDAYEKLEGANLRLEETLVAQRRFVADASHELRTPLTSLRGNVALLQRAAALEQRPEDRPEDIEEHEQLLDDMAAETERLARLVADLLLLAQVDAGQHLSLVPTQLAPVIRDAFRAARFLREGVALEVDEVSEDVWITGDADRLKQLLLILLDNALKYTPAGGRVAIGAQAQSRAGAGGVAIGVADTGPGIAKEEQALVFERFYRSDRTGGAQGAGLGLAIARWIVAEHGGVLDLDSTLGRGSTFTAWFPMLDRPTGFAPETAKEAVGGLLPVASI